MQNFHLCINCMPHLTRSFNACRSTGVLFSVILLIFCVLCQMAAKNLFRFLTFFQLRRRQLNQLIDLWCYKDFIILLIWHTIYVIFHVIPAWKLCLSLNIILLAGGASEPGNVALDTKGFDWLYIFRQWLFAGFDSLGRFWSDEVMLNTPDVSFPLNSTN